jgi:(4-(4-[2-(gamma-L-glutamylamino)ethyl]phenoxymethyl)furan-2-yl)methanamine synthase
MTTVLGLDIGGANLKAAHTAGPARLRPFALWKHPGRLAEELSALVADWPPFALLAVTMTGELCDCFATRREGVLHILGAVERVARAPVVVWHTDGQFHSITQTRANPLGAAAANWLASATFAGRIVPEGSALFVDVGSTTTDIVPLFGGRPRPAATTDPERLRCGELVYTGVKRTPLCAVLGAAVAAEFFATMNDAYLVLRKLDEDPTDTDTADGRPATVPFALARLARMLCGDAETVSEADCGALAERAFRTQLDLVVRALRPLADCGTVPTIIAAGSGEFLVRAAADEMCFSGQFVALGRRLGPELSAAACAFAVAVLASELPGP